MELLPFFIVLLAGLFFSEVFQRFHLPWVSALIVAGMVIGPHGLGWYESNPTIEFLSEIGLVFLMFLAGLETRLSSFRKHHKDISWVVLLSTAIPFVAGYFLGHAMTEDVTAALLMGVIFVSSSIAVIIPSLEQCNLLTTRFGKVTVGSTIVMDVASLVLISFVLQTSATVTSLPLPVFYVVAATAIVLLRWAVVKLWRTVDKHVPDNKDPFQEELRTLFLILIGVVIIFEILGLHPVVAGFFAGFVLSESIKNRVLIEKFRAMGYGLFVPVFFIVIGAQTDLDAFLNLHAALLFVGAVLMVAVGSKFVSGVIAGRIIGMSRAQRLLLGVATIPQLTTTLAAAFLGRELGILSDDIITAIVILVIVTSFASPLLIRLVVQSRHGKKITKE